MLVDADMLEVLTKHGFSLLHGRHKNGPVPFTEIDGKTVFLRNIVMKEIESGAAITHLDQDPLNCTRENLKVVYRRKNTHKDLILSHTTSKKINKDQSGVTYRKDRKKPWRSRVLYGGKAFYLGHYATFEEAKRVSDEHISKLEAQS